MIPVPVYLFTGFLDAGKTTMIKRMLQNQELGTAQRTLLVLCEAGDEAYSKIFQEAYGLQVERIKKAEEYTCQRLTELTQSSGCSRVIVEYNGFWPMRRFHDEQPTSWFLVGKFFCGDSRAILGYDANLQSIVGEKIRSSSMALFNRLDPEADRAPYHDLVRKYSGRCQIRYELTNNWQEEDLLPNKPPYDLTEPVLQIPDHLFGYFMIDLQRSPELYMGKKVSLRLCAAPDEELAPNERLLGRNTSFATLREAAFWGITGIFDTLPAENEWIEVTGLIVPAADDPTEACLQAESWRPTDRSLAKHVAVVY